MESGISVTRRNWLFDRLIYETKRWIDKGSEWKKLLCACFIANEIRIFPILLHFSRLLAFELLRPLGIFCCGLPSCVLSYWCYVSPMIYPIHCLHPAAGPGPLCYVEGGASSNTEYTLGSYFKRFLRILYGRPK